MTSRSRDTPPCCSITVIRIYLRWHVKQTLKPCLCSNLRSCTNEVRRREYAGSALRLPLYFLSCHPVARFGVWPICKGNDRAILERTQYYLLNKGLRKYAVHWASAICCLKGTAQQKSELLTKISFHKNIRHLRKTYSEWSICCAPRRRERRSFHAVVSSLWKFREIIARAYFNLLLALRRWPRWAECGGIMLFLAALQQLRHWRQDSVVCAAITTPLFLIKISSGSSNGLP